MVAAWSLLVLLCLMSMFGRNSSFYVLLTSFFEAFSGDKLIFVTLTSDKLKEKTFLLNEFSCCFLEPDYSHE